jgi:hypothetical protein
MNLLTVSIDRMTFVVRNSIQSRYPQGLQWFGGVESFNLSSRDGCSVLLRSLLSLVFTEIVFLSGEKIKHLLFDFEFQIIR